MSILYGAQKRFDLAIQAGERAVLYNPEDVGSHIALSYAYGMTNKNEACAEQCRQALRLDPNNPTAHENLGDSLVALGHKQEARAEWERVLQVAPQGRDSKEAREMLAKYP